LLGCNRLKEINTLTSREDNLDEILEEIREEIICCVAFDRDRARCGREQCDYWFICKKLLFREALEESIKRNIDILRELSRR